MRFSLKLDVVRSDDERPDELGWFYSESPDEVHHDLASLLRELADEFDRMDQDELEGLLDL